LNLLNHKHNISLNLFTYFLMTVKNALIFCVVVHIFLHRFLCFGVF
jgi:hypothetical protein